MAASNSGTDPSTSDIKTIHFSIMKDESRALNTSHEYQLSSLESSEYSTNQVALKYGTIIDSSRGANPDTHLLIGNVSCANYLFYQIYGGSVAGQGEYHFGILNIPIGGGSETPYNGYQPKRINEGVIFRGIFKEDSAGGCVSLKPLV
jgi:hypothetical protein